MSDPQYDVFLSHNSKDKPAVERIAEKLRALGLTPWLDKWHLAPGRSFQEGIDAGLRGSGACAVFYGPHGPGAWQKAELEVAQDRAVKDPDFRLFLVLLPGVPEPFDATALPAFLNMRTWVDLRGGYEDSVRFQPLVNAIAGIPLGPSTPAAMDAAVAPYRGLQVFDEEHADFFFGRDADVQRLLEKLKRSRFLAVVGPSGSGKSSLVRAGLLPALRNGALPGSHDWPVRVFTPGARPLDALAAQLALLDPDRPMGRTLDELRDSPRTLDLAATLLLDGRPSTTRLLLMVDQFEEIFTLSHNDQERTGFLNNLLHAATVLDGRCVIIITLRADFYPRCAAYPELAALMSSHQALVGPLDERGLRAVIVEPARRVGLAFEPGLVDTIIGDVGREPGALPLLEHALLELWERRQGTMLTLAGYRESGGVGRAIANRADAVFNRLTPPEQAVARRVLMRLTQPGEQTEDTRRRAELNELVTRPEERGAVETVINQLVAARLLTTGQAAADGEPQVDVAHEALIRAWPRLRSWLDEDREGFLAHNRLTEATQEWERLDREPDALYRGARLVEAQALAARHPDLLNDQERAFLTASVALRERELAAVAEQQRARERQRRAVVAGLGVFSLVALLLAGLAVWQWRAAVGETSRADAAANSARVAQATSEAQRTRADGEAAAALAAQATSEADRARADDEAAVALAAQATAVAQSTVAAAGRNAALTSAFNANVSRATAVAARSVAEDQERIARSRQLAAQAENQRAPDLALLLSLEAQRHDPDAVATRGSLATTLMANPNLRAVLPAHMGAMLGLAFSPDGRRVATAGADGVLQVWDSASLAPLGAPLLGDPAATLAYLAFSPDGTHLAVGGDYGVLLFDLTNPAPADSAEALTVDQPWSVTGLAFSPDGKSLAFATDQGLVIWDLATNAPRGDVLAPGALLFAVAYSPDGREVAVGGENVAQIWDVEAGERRADLRDNVNSPIYSLSYRPDGRMLAAGRADGLISFWDADRYEPAGEPIQAHGDFVSSVSFSEDGLWLASGGNDGNVAVWDVGSRLPVRGPWRGHDSGVFVVAFQPGGPLLAAAGMNGALVMWDLTENTVLSQTLPAGAGQVHGVAYSPDGGKLVTGAQTGEVAQWDAATGEPIGEPVALPDEVWAVAYRPDGSMLGAATGDGAYLWSLGEDGFTTPEPVRLPESDGEWQDAAFSPDGSLVAAAGPSGISIWRVDEQTLLRQLGTNSPDGDAFGALAISPDGRWLAGGMADGNVTVWDLQTFAPVFVSEAERGSNVLGLAFSADGAWLVQTGLDGLATITDVAAKEVVLGPVRINDGLVWDIAISPDGAQLAAVGDDGNLVLFDIAQQAAIGEPLRSAATALYRVEYAPDGATVVTGGDNGTASIWQVTVPVWRERACAIVHRNMDADTWRLYLGDEPYNPTCPKAAAVRGATPAAATPTG